MAQDDNVRIDPWLVLPCGLPNQIRPPLVLLKEFICHVQRHAWYILLNGVPGIAKYVSSFRNDGTTGSGYKKRIMLIGKRREDIYTTETTKMHEDDHR